MVLLLWRLQGLVALDMKVTFVTNVLKDMESQMMDIAVSIVQKKQISHYKFFLH